MLARLKERILSNRKDKVDLSVSGSFKDDKDDSLSDVTLIEADSEQSDAVKASTAPADLKPLKQEDIDHLIKEIFNTGFVEKELSEIATTPAYVLDTEEDHIWLYSLTKNSFFKVSKRAQIISVDVVTEDIAHCLINNDLYEVKNDIIKCIGWN